MKPKGRKSRSRKTGYKFILIIKKAKILKTAL